MSDRTFIRLYFYLFFIFRILLTFLIIYNTIQTSTKKESFTSNKEANIYVGNIFLKKTNKLLKFFLIKLISE